MKLSAGEALFIGVIAVFGIIALYIEVFGAVEESRAKGYARLEQQLTPNAPAPA